MSKAVKKIVIVGGGTAGWLSAGLIAQEASEIGKRGPILDDDRAEPGKV